MAGQNDVVVNASMDAADAQAGITDLLNSFDKLGPAAGAIGDAFEDLDLQNLFADGIQATDLFTVALRIGLDLIRETSSALEDMASAYNKATDTIERYHAKQEAARKKGQADDSITGMPPEVEAAIREKGALSRGFAAQGKWVRRFQDIGAGLTDFFSGDDSGEDNLREGRKRQAMDDQASEWNKREKERRAFAAKAEEQRYRAEQAEYDKWAKEQHDIDEKERKDEERRLLAEARTRDRAEKELGEAEAAQARRRENFEAQMKRRAIGRDDDFERPDAPQVFRGGIVGLDSIYNAAATAAGGSKVDPIEERKKIKDEEKAHREDLARRREEFDRQQFEERERREDARLNEMRKGLGLA